MKILHASYDAIVAAALAGARCPTRLQGVDGASCSALARMGMIRVEIYGKNWRVVEILTGPHAGLRTAPSPRGGKPYLVIGKITERFVSGPPSTQAARLNAALQAFGS